MIEEAVFCDRCKAPLLTKNGNVLTNPNKFTIELVSNKKDWTIVECKYKNDLKLGIISILCPNCSESRNETHIRQEIDKIKFKIKNLALEQYERKVILSAKHHVLGYWKISSLMRKKLVTSKTIKSLHFRLKELYAEIEEIRNER